MFVCWWKASSQEHEDDIGEAGENFWEMVMSEGLREGLGSSEWGRHGQAAEWTARAGKGSHGQKAVGWLAGCRVWWGSWGSEW